MLSTCGNILLVPDEGVSQIIFRYLMRQELALAGVTCTPPLHLGPIHEDDVPAPDLDGEYRNAYFTSAQLPLSCSQTGQEGQSCPDSESFPDSDSPRYAPQVHELRSIHSRRFKPPEAELLPSSRSSLSAQWVLPELCSAPPCGYTLDSPVHSARLNSKSSHCSSSILCNPSMPLDAYELPPTASSACVRGNASGAKAASSSGASSSWPDWNEAALLSKEQLQHFSPQVAATEPRPDWHVAPSLPNGGL